MTFEDAVLFLATEFPEGEMLIPSHFGFKDNEKHEAASDVIHKKNGATHYKIQGNKILFYKSEGFGAVLDYGPIVEEITF